MSDFAGHGAIMGFHTRKVLDFATRCKICRQCEAGNPKEYHDCRLNFHGSAKAMEPDMAVQLVSASTILDEAGVSVDVLVGDDDSSTMAALRRNGTVIEKWSDLNHCTKSLNNALYKLKHKSLTTGVINYLKRCFTYAIKQNKNQPFQLEKALKNIVNHVFGQHENCQIWCKFKVHPFPESKYNSLPKGECLQGDVLREALRKIFYRFAENANKIAPCASTQPNEALNSAIAAKNPKAKFYSGSESNDYRVAAAVGQVNIGTEYIVSVNTELGLSPGDQTTTFRRRTDLKRMHDRDRQRTIVTKRRRLFLKAKKKSSTARQEAREGTSYQSGMGMLASTISVPEPEPACLLKTSVEDCAIVYFDLETSGLSPSSAEVIQIAALVEDDNIYSCYTAPKKIPERVTEVTGLHMRAGNLYLQNNKLPVVSRREAWNGVVNFLENLQKPVILVGHNINFDIRFAMKELQDFNMLSNFINVVHGTVDTLKVLKNILPGRASYKQTAIAEELSAADTLTNAHNAIGDVRTLRNIVVRLLLESTIAQYCVSLADQIIKKKRNEASKQVASTLGIFKGQISAIMIGKIAAANLKLEEIRRVYCNGGEDSLYILFSENCNGRPRVTKCRKVAGKVAQILENCL